MSQFPLIQAGSTLTAALLSNMEPLVAYKPADTSRATNTTLTADPDLTLNVVTGTYLFQCYLDYEGGTQGSSDMKFKWNVPSGTLRYQPVGQSTAGAMGFANTVSAGTTWTVGSGGAGALFAVTMTGTLLSTGPGAFFLQWAQNTSSATPTIIHAQSYLLLWRVA